MLVRPTLLAVLVVAFAATVQTHGARGPVSLPPAPLPALYEVEVTGADFEWHIRYPGPDGALWTTDDTHGLRDLHVPARQAVRVHLRSRDYIYNLALPHWGVKEPAVPDLAFALAFHTGEPGVFALRGDQMCGWTHERLLGRLVVEAPEGRRGGRPGSALQ